MVSRRPDDADRRVVLLELTAEGTRRQARAGRIHLDGLSRLVEAPLAGRDLGGLTASLQALAPQEGMFTGGEPSSG